VVGWSCNQQHRHNNIAISPAQPAAAQSLKRIAVTAAPITQMFDSGNHTYVLSLMTFGVEQRSAGWLLGRLLTILFMPGITAMLASTVEQCSLLLPLQWGAVPMAMLLWLNW
jgi:hypothetical protein